MNKNLLLATLALLIMFPLGVLAQNAGSLKVNDNNALGKATVTYKIPGQTTVTAFTQMKGNANCYYASMGGIKYLLMKNANVKVVHTTKTATNLTIIVDGTNNVISGGSTSCIGIENGSVTILGNGCSKSKLTIKQTGKYKGIYATTGSISFKDVDVSISTPNSNSVAISQEGGGTHSLTVTSSNLSTQGYVYSKNMRTPVDCSYTSNHAWNKSTGYVEDNGKKSWRVSIEKELTSNYSQGTIPGVCVGSATNVDIIGVKNLINGRRYQFKVNALKSGKMYYSTSSNGVILILDNADLGNYGIELKDDQNVDLIICGTCQIGEITGYSSKTKGFNKCLTIRKGKIDDSSSYGYTFGKTVQNTATLKIGKTNANSNYSPILMNTQGSLKAEYVNLQLTSKTNAAINGGLNASFIGCNVSGSYPTLFANINVVYCSECGVNQNYLGAHPNLVFKTSKAYDGLMGFWENGKQPNIGITTSNYQKFETGEIYFNGGRPGPRISVTDKSGKAWFEYVKIGDSGLKQVTLPNNGGFMGMNTFYVVGEEKATLNNNISRACQKLLIPYSGLKGNVYYLPIDKSLLFADVTFNYNDATYKKEVGSYSGFLISGNTDNDLSVYFSGTNTFNLGNSLAGVGGGRLHFSKAFTDKYGSAVKITFNSSSTFATIMSKGNAYIGVNLTVTGANKAIGCIGNGNLQVGSICKFTASQGAAIQGFSNVETVKTRLGLVVNPASDLDKIVYDKTDKTFKKSNVVMKVVEFGSNGCYTVNTNTNTTTQNGHTVWPASKGTYITPIAN